MEEGINKFQKQPPVVFLIFQSLQIPQTSHENPCVRVSVLIVSGLSLHYIKKETLAQAFSCAFPKFLRTLFYFFYGTPPATASGVRGNIFQRRV